MAGKHEGVIFDIAPAVADKTAYPPVFPGSRVDRAYAEGRAHGQAGGLITDNPHETGGQPNTPEEDCWDHGFAGQAFAAAKIQTAN